MPAGRPSLYEPSYAERVIEFCGEGFSLTSFAGEIGVARSTINEWCQAHAEFSEAVNRAKALRARWWEERAREVALKGGPGGQATMVIFGLKNHAPDDFKEVERREHTGKGGGPILTMTPEEQRAETERRRAAAKALIDAAFAEHQRRESDAAVPGLPT